MPHAMSCEDEEGRYLQKIEEQITENEMFCANYFALPISEEAEEGPVVRGNDVCGIKIYKMKKKVAMISEVMPRLVERYSATN